VEIIHQLLQAWPILRQQVALPALSDRMHNM